VDQFKVDFTFVCLDDELTVTPISNQVYNFDEGNKDLDAPVFAHSAGCTDCDSTFKLEVYNNATHAWQEFGASHGYFISNFDTSTGVVSITSDGDITSGDKALRPVTMYILRISLTSTYSKTTQRKVASEFSLTLKNRCYGNTLVKGNSLANVFGSDTMSDIVYRVAPAGSAHSDG
jgi:hypothetical protein